MILKGISQSAPTLGGVVTSNVSSVMITPVTANRPYIMGSIVAGITPTPIQTPSKAFIGQPTGQQEILGVMCLGAPQVEQRNAFVRSGFNAEYNNMGAGGTFWCALDLQHFNKATIDALQGTGILSVDKNGVLSYSTQNIQNNTAGGGQENNTMIEPHCACVYRYYDKPVLGAIDEVINVGQTAYTFKYPKGIGIIEVRIR